jgi:hypothetical protein
MLFWLILWGMYFLSFSMYVETFIYKQTVLLRTGMYIANGDTHGCTYIKYYKAFIRLITALLIMWSFVVFYGNHNKIMISNEIINLFIDIYGNWAGFPLYSSMNIFLFINSTIELPSYLLSLQCFLIVMFIYIALICRKIDHPEFQNICCF